MMTLQEYQNQSKRTLTDLGTKDKNLYHMMLGVLTEMGEFADCWKKHMAYGKPLDETNLKEEWADTMWYIAGAYTIRKETMPKLEDIITNVEEELDSFNSQISDNKEEVVIMSCIPVIANIIEESDLTSFVVYMYVLATIFNINTNDALETNIQKLKKRFPEKFSQEDATNRNLKAERDALENN